MRWRLGLVGPGRVGTALCDRLLRAGHCLIGVVARTERAAAAACARMGAGRAFGSVVELALAVDVLIITTPDHAVGHVADSLRGTKEPLGRVTLVHTSGALPASVLAVPGVRGWAAMHPLQTFADRAQAQASLPGSYFGIEGTPEGLAVVEQLVADLDGRILRVPESKKALYHAAACIASNYLTVLVDTAVTLCECIGWHRREALAALQPLVRAAAQATGEVGTPGSLTGPIERGDIQTIAGHLRALTDVTAAPTEPQGSLQRGPLEQPVAVEQLYRLLGQATVGLAVRKGSLSDEKASALLTLLRGQDKGCGQ